MTPSQSSYSACPLPPSLPVQEDDLHVHVLPVLVQKVLEEVRDGLVGDVSADDDVPERVEGKRKNKVRGLNWRG